METQDPHQAFGDFLSDAGLVIEGEPIMDGAKQRVQTHEDKLHEKSGVYAGYLDGRPAGWAINYREHDKPQKWVSESNTTIDKYQLERQKIESAERRVNRQQDQEQKWETRAKEVSEEYSKLSVSDNKHRYLKNKNVEAALGVKVDDKNRLVIPLQDENGKIHSLQRIGENGFKTLERDAKKSGNFFIVGGVLKDGEPILYAEGYSTAASIHEATYRPVVMTIDAGNLPTVADKLSKKYPSSQQIILGDDDHGNKINKGKESALKAANLSGGIAIFPKFDNSKGQTDFNDLAAKQGITEVRQQIESIISKQTEVKNMDTTQSGHRGIPDNSQPNEQTGYKGSPPHYVIEDKINDYISDREFERVDFDKATRFHTAKDAVYTAIEIQDGEKAKNLNIYRVSKNGPENRATLMVGDMSKKSHRDLLIEQWDTKIKGEGKLEESTLYSSEKEKQDTKQTNLDLKPQEDTREISQTGSIVPERIKPEVEKVVTNTFEENNGKWNWKENPDVNAFREKGDRVITRSDSPLVAKAMIAVADSRGWDSFIAKGKEPFRKEAWIEGNLRGMKVQGYTPDEKDLKELNDKQGIIERTPSESKPADKLSEAYHNLSKSESIKKHPELEGVHKTVMLANNFANRKIPDQESRDKFLKQMETLALSEAKEGSFKVKQVVERQQEHEVEVSR